jgi:glycoside/pentoside/hexuronide:cation symporter, GPH family
MTQDTLSAARQLSRKLMILYGLPHLTHTVVVLPMALFIPSYYADELGLPMASVGMAIAASRLLDMILDPIVGVMSDRMRSRWGRRKPWLAVGTPLLILCAWMVFVPGKQVSVTYLFAWSSLLYLAYTFVDLPYKAWGAELSTDYAERSRVTAWREAFGFFGQMLFLAILILMALNGISDIRLQLLAIATLIVVSQPLLVAATLWKVPERTPEILSGADSQVTPNSEPIFKKTWAALGLMLQNHAFLRTLAAIVFFGTAVLMQATLHRFVLNHIVKAPNLFAPMIMAENFCSILCLPVWIWISDHIGKHRAISLAALWVAFWSIFLPFVEAGDTVLYVTLILLRGSSLASIFFLASSIAADVVDLDTVISGKQRTGLYFSVWGIASKLSIGLGVLLATSLPSAFGFDPSQAIHTEASISALLAIYGWLPCLIMILGVPFLWNFPIDKHHQQELRNKIAAAVISEELTGIGK